MTLLVRVKELLQRKRHEPTEEELEHNMEAEIARNLWVQHKIFPPTSPRRRLWNMLMLYLVLYNCIQIPLSLAFTFEVKSQDGLDYFDIFVDAAFGVDILLNFRTSYYEEEELVHDTKAIAKKYFYGWFSLDLLATFPWQALGLRYLKIIKVARLSRLAKGGSLRGASSARILRLGGGWMLVAHWIACIWFFIGTYEWEKQKDSFTPLEYESWMIRVAPVGRARSSDDSFSRAQFNNCVQRCLNTFGVNPEPEGTGVRIGEFNNNSKKRMDCITGLRFPLYIDGTGNPGNQSLSPSGEPLWDWCDDNNFFPYLQDDLDWFNQYISCFYWSLTMLMKTPFVGPDTVLEKVFACFVVILGAILFALLLGQVTAFFNSLGKASAQLRDAVGTAKTFCATRDVPFRMRQQLYKQITADWGVTLGMESKGVLAEFPPQLRLEVLKYVYVTLLETNPPFLRCSEQLKLSILGILKPGIALKKENIITGGHFGSTAYILIKGSLNVTLSPNFGEPVEEEKSSVGGGRPSRATSMRGGKMGKLGGTFKEKLKSRMLERPGSMIPPESIFVGQRPSPFGITAVIQTRILTFDATELARMLDSYEEIDQDIVCEALEKEFNGLIDSLKGKPSKNQASSDDTNASQRTSGGSPVRKNRKPGPQPTPQDVLQERVTKLEGDIEKLTEEMDLLKQSTEVLPLVLRNLVHRFVPDSERPQTAESDLAAVASLEALSLPTASPASSNTETPESTNRSKGGFFGLGGKSRVGDGAR